MRTPSTLAAAALLVATCGVAHAQFTSTYSYVNIAATFNGFNTFDPNMTLISNGVWQAYVDFPTGGSNRFLFATRNFTNTWKETNQSVFTIPMTGTAEFNTGNDIVISNTPNGLLKFTFNESTRAYSIVDVSFGEGGGDVWINEIHYDHVGTDTNEFIEIAGPAGTDLTRYRIYAYNGNGGASYRTNVFTGTMPNQQGGYGTASVKYSTDGLQNGAPDAIALVKDLTNVLQFLSYEGVFVAANGPAAGLQSQDIGVEEGGSTPVDFSLQLSGDGAKYESFGWIGPTNATRDLPNVGQTFLLKPLPASVTISNLVNIPTFVTTSSTTHIQAQITPGVNTSNLFATAFYRTSTNARYSPIAMTIISGNTYRTASPITNQPSGTLVQYYTFVSFSGPGTNSPTIYPDGAPSNNVRFFNVPKGNVWINEVFPEAAFAGWGGFGEDTNEFVEIAGVAGQSIGGWKLEFYQVPGVVDFSVTFPTSRVLGNDTNGFGFFVVGDSNMPNVELVFTNPASIGGSHIPSSGAIKLVDAQGLMQHFVYYGSAAQDFPGAQYLGEPDFFDDRAFGFAGTGGTVSAFTWITNVYLVDGFTVGRINKGQVFVGGNTNSLPPFMQCPTNIFLSCTSDPIPAPNTSSVVATGLCGNGSVTVTWMGDVTNGTGCASSPKVIFRTYRAVSACATTSSCTQIITIQDTNPPTINAMTQTLVNAGFEFGSLLGWTTVGGNSDAAYVDVINPDAGDFHAVLGPPYSALAVDSSGNGHDGQYIGVPVRAVPAVSASNGTAVAFDGINDVMSVPYDTFLSASSFAFSAWAKVTGTANRIQTVLTGSDIANTRGYILYASTTGTWQFWTGGGPGKSWQVQSGPTVATGSWVHLAGTMSSLSATSFVKRFYVNGALVSSNTLAEFSANAASPFLVGASRPASVYTNLLFGVADDVQVYDTALAPSDITFLYNSGVGGRSTNPAAHYRMNESFSSGAFTGGLMQVLGAASGQTWSASAQCLVPAADPLFSNNTARIELQFLDGASNVLSTTLSTNLTKDTQRDVYIRLQATAKAPSNTVYAAFRAISVQPTAGSGSVYLDETWLTPYTVTNGTGCVVSIPDFRNTVTASDSCGAVTVTQSPTAGSNINAGTNFVQFVATDVCGLSRTTTVSVVVPDVTAPVATSAPLTVSCQLAMPTIPTSTIFVTDCSPVTISILTESNNGANGCSGSPRITTRRYLVTDTSGNSTITTQVITQVTTNSPVVTMLTPASLLNAGFESGSMANWNTFGTSVTVVTNQPRSGTRSVQLTGNFNGVDNVTGFYQDIPVYEGQTWRAAAYVLTPTNNPISGANYALVKIEYFDSTFALLQTIESPLFTTNRTRGSYHLLEIEGLAPAGTRNARLVGIYYQFANAPGVVQIDDISLSMTTVSSGTNCTPVAPDMRSLLVATNNCNSLTLSQVPAIGSPLVPGTNLVRVIATDACGRGGTGTVSVVVVDAQVPVITNCPANLQLASTNAIPAADTNIFSATDNCGTPNRAHLGDVSNGGAGTTNNPLVITRTYRATDASGNAATCVQLLTVINALTPAPTNVVIQSIEGPAPVVIRSRGTNTWSVSVLYTTNLLSPQTWLPVTSFSNQYLGSTNITTLTAPVTNVPIFYRIRQVYP